MDRFEELFYIETTSGDLKLVEIVNKGESLLLKIGSFDLEIKKDTAFELADALLISAAIIEK